MAITYPTPYCFYRGTFSVEKLDEINTIIFDVDEKIIEFRICNQSNNLLAIDWQFVISEIKGDNNCEIKLVEETSIEIESGQDKTIEIPFKFYRPESDLSETRINGEIKFISDSNEIPIKLQFRAPRNDIADRIEKREETPEDVGEQVYNSWSDKINSRGLVFGEYITNYESFKKFADEDPKLNQLLKRHESSKIPFKTFNQKFNDINPLTIDMGGVNIGVIKKIYYNNESIEYKIEVNIINNSAEEKVIQILNVNCNNVIFGSITVDNLDAGLPIIKMKSSLPVICKPNDSSSVSCTFSLSKGENARGNWNADPLPKQKQNIWSLYHTGDPKLTYLIRFNNIDYGLMSKTLLKKPPLFFIPLDKELEPFNTQYDGNWLRGFENGKQSIDILFENIAYWLLKKIQWISDSSEVDTLLEEQLSLSRIDEDMRDNSEVLEDETVSGLIKVLGDNHNDITLFELLKKNMLEIQCSDSPFIQIKSDSNHRSDGIKLEISNDSGVPISDLSMDPILEDGNELFGEFNDIPNIIGKIGARHSASKVVKLDFTRSDHCSKIMKEIPQFTIRGVIKIKGNLGYDITTEIIKEIPFFIDVSNRDGFLFRGD